MDRYFLPRGIQEIAEKGRIDDSAVRLLRTQIYRDGIVSPDEAETLFWLNEACPEGSSDWTDFFAQALTDYLVDQTDPAGYVSDDAGEWLAARILRDGRIDSHTELELLVRLIEQAIGVPQKLVLFAMGEVRSSVLTGSGPVRDAAVLKPGVIGDAEVTLLSRVLYGLGSEGNMAVSRLEAELLFDLNDAIVDAENPHAWADLFVKAIANHIMAAPLWTAPSRHEAAVRDEWLSERDGTLGFMRKMAAGSLVDAIGDLVGGEETDEQDRRDEQIADAEMVTQEEASWLSERIGRDGTLHDNEKALLAFLKREAPNIHPSLRSLIERAA